MIVNEENFDEKENVDLIRFLKSTIITQNEYDILFSSKEDWYIIEDNGDKDWSTSNNKQIIFWEIIKKIKKIFENQELNLRYEIYRYNFSFIQFPPLIINNSKILYNHFNNSISNFHNEFSINFNKVTFHGKFIIFDSILNYSLDFRNCIFLDDVGFNNITFTKKEVFKNSIFKNSIIIDNVNFNNITIFKNTKFYDDVAFRGVTFNEWASFNNISSFKKLNFTYSRTKDLIDFSNSKIYSIDLEHTRFASASFLHLKGLNENGKIIALNKSNISNKESARLIKTHFEKENNIAEANKYFQIEQNLYIEQLKTEQPKDANKWKNLFVLYLNKYVSTYSTDWIRPLLVMFIFGFIASLGYSFLQNGDEEIKFMNYKIWISIGILHSILIYYFYHKKLWVAFFASITVYIFILLGDIQIREISNNISKLVNPLNIFKSKDYFEHIAPYGMFIKLIIATLIYQFIMAFRQNTRRK